jgi:hypothetical protein
MEFSDNGETEATEEQMVEQGAMDSSEEGFMAGYAEEEEIEECSECGGAIKPEKKVVKEISEETYKFCCEQCAKEFEENIGE